MNVTCLIFICTLNYCSGAVIAPYYLVKVDPPDDALNGCYEKTGEKNVNDYHEASTYPIYQQIGRQKFYLSLENANHACWIFSTDMDRTNVKYKKR